MFPFKKYRPALIASIIDVEEVIRYNVHIV